jgi:hypothetical protein
MARESRYRSGGLRACLLLLLGCLAACGGRFSTLDGGGSGAPGMTRGGGGSASTSQGGTGTTLAQAGLAEPGGGRPPGNAGAAGSHGGLGGSGTAGVAGTPPGVGGYGACPGNQIKLGGVCGCPPYAPTFCEADNKCVNTTKDPDHCGDCNFKCGATNACAASVCSQDVLTLGEVADCGSLELLTVPGRIYALSTKNGTLSSMSIPAGGALISVATGLLAGHAFALDATNAYVAAGATVTRVNLTTGAKTLLVSEPNPVWDVAVAQGKIYYATGKNIMQADATTPGTGVLVAAAADEGEPQGVAVSGNNVVYVSNVAFNVETDPIVGDDHLKLAASQANLIFGHRSVQANDTFVYWVNAGVLSARVFGPDYSSQTIGSPIDGGVIVAFAVQTPTRTTYFATMDGSLEKSLFSAGSDEATWMARGLAPVSSVVLDDTFLYLASGCKILRSVR